MRQGLEDSQLLSGCYRGTHDVTLINSGPVVCPRKSSSLLGSHWGLRIKTDFSNKKFALDSFLKLPSIKEWA